MIMSTVVAYGIVSVMVAVNVVWFGVVARPLFQHGIWHLRRGRSIRAREASSLTDGQSG